MKYFELVDWRPGRPGNLTYEAQNIFGNLLEQKESFPLSYNGIKNWILQFIFSQTVEDSQPKEAQLWGS